LIAATEGGIIKVGDLYYLWGMDRSANNYAFVGINLYSSPDLKKWTFVNQILKKSSHPDLDNDAVVERAKLLYNEKTGQFVIWMHYEGHDAYKIAEVGYATCSTIGGNYTFKSHFRPMDIDSRDINVYQDDDGKAYLICTTFGNQNVSLFELDNTYTSIVKEVYRGSASTDMECEGHAIIKQGGYYFWMMSWCTGWDFNDNHYFYATKLSGPWTAGGKIAVANTHTYESQVGFAVTVKGLDTTSFLYTGDRWSVSNYSMSRIVMLPVTVSGTKLSVGWQDQYSLDVKTGRWAAGARDFLDGVYTITAKHSGLVLGTNGSAIQQQTPSGATTQQWRIQNLGASHFKITSVANSKPMDVSGASREVGAKVLNYEWSDAYNQKWQLIDCGDGFFRMVSVNTLGKTIEISGNSKNTGIDAVLGNFSYRDHQLWRFTLVNGDFQSGKYYAIVNRGSGKALDCGTGSPTTALTQQTLNRQTPQVWKLEELYNSYFKITSYSSKRSLDNGGKADNSAPIIVDTISNTFGQQWQIVPVETNFYKIVNRFSGKLLDNLDNVADDGNPIVQYSDYSSTNTNQQWKFVPVDAISVKNPVYNRTESRIPKHTVVYDMRGRLVADKKQSGKNRMVSKGIYFVLQNSIPVMKNGCFEK
ncbi:MAG TPA: RICIN domain-containing protein, partial [Chitinispirillaceae bacterium]|nr:RICIN domain-containing protein [Chitinispirillaceae bacterium]